MEEKDEFSDILLEQESDKKASKFKKIALFVAIFILIFIVVLVVMKLLNPSEDSATKPQNIPQEDVKPATQTKDDPLFKQVPIIKENDKKESFDELVKKLREKELKKEREKRAQLDKKPSVNEPKIVPIKKIEAKPTKVVKKQSQKVTPKKVDKKTIPTIPLPKGVASSGNIYIQVLATSKSKPDAKFISKVKSKNYPYKLHKTTINGKPYLKVLVGPYKNRQSAKNALDKVRKDLNPKAFLFSMK